MCNAGKFRNLTGRAKRYLSVENRTGYDHSYIHDGQGDPVPAKDGKYHVIQERDVSVLASVQDLGWPFPQTINDRPLNEPDCYVPGEQVPNPVGWLEQYRMVAVDWGVPGGFQYVAA
ncbi:MAG: hypothetical protein ACYC26_11265 [Phycisphaerales bacterium]